MFRVRPDILPLFFKGGLRGISPAASFKIPPGPPLRKGGGEKAAHNLRLGKALQTFLPTDINLN